MAAAIDEVVHGAFGEDEDLSHHVTKSANPESISPVSKISPTFTLVVHVPTENTDSDDDRLLFGIIQSQQGGL